MQQPAPRSVLAPTLDLIGRTPLGDISVLQAERVIRRAIEDGPYAVERLDLAAFNSAI